MWRAFKLCLLLSGSLAFLLGATADLLRSDDHPGLGPAQIGLMLIGLALALAGVALPARAPRAALPPRWRRRAVPAAAGVLIAAVLTTEAVLALLGARPLYSREAGNAELTLAPWWRCDQLGCRFDPDHARAEPPQGLDPERRTYAEIYFDRMARVNSQGFHDDDEFVQSPALERRARVLALGDSFTFGFFAPIGASWLEQMTARLGPADGLEVWNTGIPGAATVQELAILRHLFPVMRPDLVILGFYPGNDLDGNLHPAGSFYALEGGRLVLETKVGPGFRPIRMTPADAYYRATGIRVLSDAGAIEALLGRTRAGSLLLRRWAKLRHHLEWIWSAEARRSPGPDAKRQEAESRTRALLREMRDLVEGRGSRFLVLLIPGPNDLEHAGERYLKGRRLLQDLSLEVVEVLDALAADDYLPADEHWNAEGHGKVGRLVAERVRGLL